MTCEEKITLGEMRASGVRGLLIYCSDYKRSHWTRISGDQWWDRPGLIKRDYVIKSTSAFDFAIS